MKLIRPMSRTTPQSPLSRGGPLPRSGITLVEVTVSTLLVGMLVVASLQSVANIGRTWTATNQLVDGQALTQELIPEMLAQNYTDPTDPNATTWGK